ncbi:retrovirus-related pol polyprotein from transposon TNT 1-94 [Tanacetum coccineum]
MASEYSSSGPALHEMTPATPSSGLIPNPPSPAPFVPPTRKEWDMAFQPVFDKLFNPLTNVDSSVPGDEILIPAVEVQAPVESTGSPSSITIDQDAPSTSTSQTSTQPQSQEIPFDAEEENHDLEVTHMSNDPYFGIPILEIASEESSSSDVIPPILLPDTPVSEHISRWTKDHLLHNIIGELSRPVSIRLQLHEQALFYYYDAFLTSVEPKTYKESLTQSCWIEAMQEELNEFERLEVWELVPRPDRVMVITLKWIYKVKLDELGGILKNKARLVARGYRQEEGIDFEESFAPISRQKKSMFSQSQKVFVIPTNPIHVYRLKKLFMGWKAVDPTHYRGMVGTLMYLTSSRPDLVYAVCMCARYQARPTEKHLHAVKRIFCTSGSMQMLGYRLVSWSSKRQKSAVISSTEAKYIALSGCCAQVLWMRSQLTDYGLGFNKILMYCDKKSAIALCCNNVQHSWSKHIDIRYHFIKEQVKNGVVELYFVKTDYQLADIFTKALCRERIEFLFDKLRMRSFTPETLKELT